jgi:hypothetical protein
MKTKTALTDLFAVLEIHGILEEHQKANFERWKSIFLQMEKNYLLMAYIDGRADQLAGVEIDSEKYFNKTFTTK